MLTNGVKGMVKMSFEDSVKKIEDIIKQLSEGEIPLGEAVELYKQGTDELAACRKELDSAKMKIISAQDIEEEIDG